MELWGRRPKLDDELDKYAVELMHADTGSMQKYYPADNRLKLLAHTEFAEESARF